MTVRTGKCCSPLKKHGGPVTRAVYHTDRDDLIDRGFHAIRPFASPGDWCRNSYCQARWCSGRTTSWFLYFSISLRFCKEAGDPDQIAVGRIEAHVFDAQLEGPLPMSRAPGFFLAVTAKGKISPHSRREVFVESGAVAQVIQQVLRLISPQECARRR